MEQVDAFGVSPQGAITSEDFTSVATKVVALELYIERLQKRILELTRVPETPIENGAAAVDEAAEIVKGKAKA